MKETYERIYTTACYFETPSVLQVDGTEEKKNPSSGLPLLC